MPQGRKVEQVFPRKDSRRIVATAHIFTTPAEWNRVVVYEDMSLLSSGRYEIKPFSTNGWASLVLRASDDTDPTTKDAVEMISYRLDENTGAWRKSEGSHRDSRLSRRACRGRSMRLTRSLSGCPRF